MPPKLKLRLTTHPAQRTPQISPAATIADFCTGTLWTNPTWLSSIPTPVLRRNLRYMLCYLHNVQSQHTVLASKITQLLSRHRTASGIDLVDAAPELSAAFLDQLMRRAKSHFALEGRVLAVTADPREVFAVAFGLAEFAYGVGREEGRCLEYQAGFNAGFEAGLRASGGSSVRTSSGLCEESEGRNGSCKAGDRGDVGSGLEVGPAGREQSRSSRSEKRKRELGTDEAGGSEISSDDDGHVEKRVRRDSAAEEKAVFALERKRDWEYVCGLSEQEVGREVVSVCEEHRRVEEENWKLAKEVKELEGGE